jgi:ATP-dependent DNA ligase
VSFFFASRSKKTPDTQACRIQMRAGPDLFRLACRMGLEGLVSKHRDSLYRGGRFDRWVEVKNWRIRTMATEATIDRYAEGRII